MVAFGGLPYEAPTIKIFSTDALLVNSALNILIPAFPLSANFISTKWTSPISSACAPISIILNAVKFEYVTGTGGLSAHGSKAVLL